MAPCVDFAALRASPADLRVVTSDGSSIDAHSSVLNFVLFALGIRSADLIESNKGRGVAGAGADDRGRAARRGRDADLAVVRVLGAPSDAVAAFLRFLYCPKDTAAEWAEAAAGAHGAALLALAHAYRVPWLKRRAEAAVAARLAAERAVDALKLAALCDAPRLYLACARLAGKDLGAVERSEGWRFAGRHDAALQLELIQLLHDADQRKERWERERASQHVFRQLNDAMALLDRIFSGDGDGEACAEASPCEDGVRRGLEQLMRHFAACGRTKKPAACPRCRRAFQLLRLHASVCDRAGAGGEPCRVPLCSNLKAKMQEEGVDKTWRLLVKKVTRAKVMSALVSREVPEVVKKSWAKYSSRRAARFR